MIPKLLKKCLKSFFTCSANKFTYFFQIIFFFSDFTIAEELNCSFFYVEKKTKRRRKS